MTQPGARNLFNHPVKNHRRTAASPPVLPPACTNAGRDAAERAGWGCAADSRARLHQLKPHGQQAQPYLCFGKRPGSFKHATEKIKNAADFPASSALGTQEAASQSCPKRTTAASSTQPQPVPSAVPGQLCAASGAAGPESCCRLQEKAEGRPGLRGCFSLGSVTSHCSA